MAGLGREGFDRGDMVCMLHTVKSADVIRLLEADGWTVNRVRGSHHVFRHPNKPGIVVVPHPKKDLGRGLVTAILKQAGIPCATPF